MAIKPILFNTEMVKAILEGRKTQTRRIAFPRNDLREFDHPPYTHWFRGRAYKSFDSFLKDCQTPKCKYLPGDILWVRETWSTTDKCGLFPPWPSNGTHYMYKGDSLEQELIKEARWFPSIHMPKEAARIFLRVKDVRMERLQDMDEEAAIAEGFADSPAGTDSPLLRFTELWDKTVKRDDLREFGYHANPWIWVIEFERCEKPEGWC